MAAAASSSSSSQTKYDVFLSFRGDTRCTFTSHLYAALCRKNIKTFIDDEEIKKGDELSPILLDGIEGSKISIVIFSKDYASSTWCLNELLKIIECKNTKGQILLSVFYHVDPSQVRKQRGTYEKAFAKHERDNPAKVQEWRMAMYEAANCVGWDSSNTRLESELVDSIVQDVLQKLNYMFNPQIPSGLVGIHKRVEYIESLLCNGSTNVRILGIWGMGGVGKTTIADVLFKKLSRHFEGCCFIENVKEELKIHGKPQLRNILLNQILGDQKLYICTPSMHSTFTPDRLQRRKVLVVLDDVSDSHQIEDLIGNSDWFGPGSILIVTTRDKEVLMNENGVLYYEVKQLNVQEALHLFSLNAFRRDQPKEEFREMSEMVVEYAMGLPLALKVLGLHLYSKSHREWEYILENLKKVPNPEIHRVLSLSYEGLDSSEKSIFLDIACCLKGESKCRVKCLLDNCDSNAEIRLSSLENKSLINISDDGKVNMHDMIQAMGWQIVREQSIKYPYKRSRLWDPEEIYCIFKKKWGGDYSVESISLDISVIKEVEISPDTFARMPHLRLLKFYLGCDQIPRRSNIRVPEAIAFLFDELRYLRWDGFPLKALPTSFDAEMLVELDLRNSLIERLWDDEQDLNNLKSLCLSHCKHLIELPNLSKAERLQEIDLRVCESLRHVPSSIFSPDCLSALNMEGCKELRCIGSDIHSKSLQWVNLARCSKLVEFSVVSEKLEYLNLDGTAIEELSSLGGRGRNLSDLNVCGCERLNSLPNNLYQKSSDASIRIERCPRLQKLPPIIETSPYIKILVLDYCSNLSELPDNLGLLSALDELSVQETSIETLPASIKLLSKLTALNISYCKRLRSLPELPLSLCILDARRCSSLEIVSGSTAAPLFQRCFNSQNGRLLPRQFHESEVSVDMFDIPLGVELFDFSGCIRLNENGCKVIVDEAINRIKSAACTFSMLQACWDPSHPSHPLFKDCHIEVTRHFKRPLCPCRDYQIWKSNGNSYFSHSTLRLYPSKKKENTGYYDNSRLRISMEKKRELDIWFHRHKKVHVNLPGSSIPRWFRYRATGNRLTIQLHPHLHLLGFAFCLVFSPLIMSTNEDYFSYSVHWGVPSISSVISLPIPCSASDTVSLFYHSIEPDMMLEVFKKSIANDKSGNCNLEVPFRFYWQGISGVEHENGIKECGVWPIHASDLEDENKKKLKKKRKRNLVIWNWKNKCQALVIRKKKNYFFKHRNGTKLSSTSSTRAKARLPKSLNELQHEQRLPQRKKSKRSQDIDELADGPSGIAAVGGFRHDN